MLSEFTPRCPRCRQTACVVWVKNPHGGYMHHCNTCGEEWTERPPEQDCYDDGGLICGEDGT